MSIKQHTRLWRSLKNHYLGANDCASILGHGFNTVDEVIKMKVTGIPLKISPDQQSRMDHGTMYEPLVRKECAERNGLTIRETGMRFHGKHKFLCASPDGIYADTQGQSVLTEFKVLSDLSDGKIPYKYWIQMQVQMEVWGVQTCLYCENLVKDGVIKEYYEHIVIRDQQWFNQVLPVILSTWKRIELEREASRRQDGASSRKRKSSEDLNYPVIMASMLVNYLRNDPLLDWLDKYGSDELRDKGVPKFFTMYNRLSNEFSTLVLSYIKQTYGDLVHDIDEAPVVRTSVPVQADQIKFNQTSVLRTINAIREGKPIILNGCFEVKHEGYILQDRADILVLNSYLQRVFGVKDSSNPNMYSIVHIQYSKLELNRNGITLANNNKQKAYKAKTWFLSKLLGHAQGYQPDSGYIIGRSYKYGETKISNVFGHIATVYFKDEVDAYMKALQWQIMLQTDQAANFSPQPNMKNHNDFPWHNYKKYLSQQSLEITQMYRCGTRVKSRASERGITRWSDLTPDVFGTENATSVGMAFLSAQEGNIEEVRIQIAAKIRTNLPPHRIRFYLDFESTGSMYDDFSTFPEEGANRNLIFLIGVIAEDRQTGETEYFSYIADELDEANEIDILQRMLQDMRGWMLARYDEQREVPFYYWSDAERQMLTQALGSERLYREGLCLVDMCKIFREAKIILPGQFGYGLKEIGDLMRRYGMIETGWGDSSDISNGLDAMVEAIRVYKFKDHAARQEFFSNVVRYNYVDCKVMQEIGNLAP